jgi:hypothetical protein
VDNNYQYYFQGSDCDKESFARYLSSHWNDVRSRLNDRAVDWLVDEIAKAMLKAPSQAYLVTDPEVVVQIEDHPKYGMVELDRWNDKAPVGFEWEGKRLKSIGVELFLEIIDNPGIYFGLSHVDFRSLQPFIGHVSGQVGKATEGIAVAVKFFKGVFNSITGLPLTVLNTAAKGVDMLTMGFAALGKWTGWYNVSWTCISDTCKAYESGQVSHSDLIKQAFADASIIIPMYEEGKKCFQGDPEACGGLVPIDLLAFYPKGSRGFKVQAESAVRQAIDRPKGSRGQVESAVRQKIERPKERSLTGEEAPPSKFEPSQKSKAEPLPKSESAAGANIDAFAERHAIRRELLEAEISELRLNADDATKVKPLTDPLFDAEMSTSDKHTFRRKRKKEDRWCRRSKEKCGLSVPEEIDEKVDATLKEIEDAAKRKKKPSKTKDDPSIDPKEARRAEIEKRAEKTRREKEKAAKDVRQQKGIERLENEIEGIDSAMLRIQNEQAAVKSRRMSGPERKAKLEKLVDEFKRYYELKQKRLAELAALKVDPIVLLRAFSYSTESGITVVRRANGWDEYSLLPGGPGQKVKKPSIDHLVSVDTISRMDKFWNLHLDDQKAILSLEYNLFLMEGEKNSSKGMKRTSDWEAAKRLYSEEQWKAMVTMERDIKARIQAEIYRRWKLRPK